MLEFLRGKRGPTVAVVNDVAQYRDVLKVQQGIIARQERTILLLVDALVGRYSPAVARQHNIIPGAVPISQTQPDELTDEEIQADLEAMTGGQ